jgi:hypothetical protein
MAEKFTFEIEASSSGAENSLKELGKSLEEGKQAAEAFSHILDGDLAEALGSVTELGKTLGLTMELAFPVGEVIAFVQVIAEVADKLSKLVADTFIYTDEQKQMDAQVRSSNQVIAGYAAQIKALDDAYAKMGKTASQQTAIDLQKLQAEFDKTDEDVNRLTRELAEAREKAADPNLFNARAYSLDLPRLNNELGAAQQKRILLQDQLRNLTEQFREQQNAEFLAMAQAEVQGRERVREAAVNAEKAKWDRIRELTHTSVEQNVAAETGFENRLYQIKLDALAAQRDLLKLDPYRNTAQITTLNREIQALYQDHQAALTRIQIEGDRERKRQQDQENQQRAQEVQQILKDAKAENDAKLKELDERQKAIFTELDGEMAHEEALGELKKKAIDFDLQMGRISQKEHDKRLEEEIQAETAAAIEILRVKQSWYDKDSKEYAQLENQIQKLHDKTALEIQKIDQSTALKQQKIWQDAAKGMSSAITGALNSWIQGSQTLSQAWTKMAEDMAMKFIQGLEKQMLAFIQASITKNAIGKADSEKDSLRNAIDAAGKSYHWAAAWGGPPAGAIAAALAFSAVEAFGSAEGGQYLVPGDQLTMLHRNEMVLPAGVADRMRGVIDGGGGGGVSVLVNHSVNAVDADSFRTHIRRHANMIGSEVARVLKRKAIS